MKWYKKTRLLHIPVSMAGVVIDVLALLFLITVFRAIDRHSHSVSDTFYGFFLYFVSTLVVVEWIATKTS